MAVGKLNSVVKGSEHSTAADNSLNTCACLRMSALQANPSGGMLPDPCVSFVTLGSPLAQPTDIVNFGATPNHPSHCRALCDDSHQ